MNDIKEQKGRTKRKIFTNGYETITERNKFKYGAARVAKGDKEFTKFLEKKERAQGHH